MGCPEPGMAARLPGLLASDPLPCLCVLSLLKQLVPLATATSGGNKLYHVIVLCVEKGFLFCQFKFTHCGTGGNL